MRTTVLLVDDEPQMVRLLQRFLHSLNGIQVETAFSGEEALEKVAYLLPEVVVSDIKMPGIDGITLLEKVREKDPTISVILITGYGTIEMAVEAIKKGAYDFLAKPFDKDYFCHVVKRALERTQLLRENMRLRSSEEPWWEGLGLIGRSPVFKELMNMVEQVARCDATVLIRGESGTGKELIARAIHRLSARGEKEMVAINCAAIPENILESELFGYVKGAFTGADRDKPGLFQEAHHSTIFLDEIGDMPLNLQVKLLRVLQDGEVRPLGATYPVKVNVRVIASTNQDLEAKMDSGQFREDLYYRLNEITLWVPPLRERGEDILLLAQYFRRKYAAEFGKEVLDFSPDALEFLVRQPWKGNVRELENAVKRAVLLCRGPEITSEDLKGSFGRKDLASSTGQLYCKPYHQAKRELLEQFARNYFRELLKATKGNVTQAARMAGLERQSLQRLLRQYGISAETFRNETSS